VRNKGKISAIDASTEGDNARTHPFQDMAQIFFFPEHHAIVTDS
jgi:hypothetical protein